LIGGLLLLLLHIAIGVDKGSLRARSLHSVEHLGGIALWFHSLHGTLLLEGGGHPVTGYRTHAQRGHARGGRWTHRLRAPVVHPFHLLGHLIARHARILLPGGP
jgi:hypothetical protein